MISSQCGLPMCGQQDQLKLGFLGVLGQEFSVQNASPQLELIAFSTGTGRAWAGWLVYTCSVLGSNPCNHEAQDRVCPLGLMTIISSHAGNLRAVSYWVQDMQVAAICLTGAGGTLVAASCRACTAAAVTQWCVPEVLGMQPGQDMLDKASASMLVFPAL